MRLVVGFNTCMVKRSPVSKTSLGWMGRLLIAAGVILLVISGWFWWSKVFNSPANVFNGMLARSLSTTSVTRHVVQNGSGSGQEEVTQLNFGAQNFAHTETTVTQKDQTGQASTVVTESIGTPKADYARYVSIKTAQKSSSGKPLDYSQVVSVWGKSDSSSASSTGGYFNQAILGIIPFGNLEPRERHALLNEIRQNNVYVTDYSKVQTKKVNERKVYVYTVSVNPQAYVRMLQDYAKDIGQGTVAGLDASSYAGAKAVSLQLTVDTISRQLVSIGYPGQAQANSRTEQYTGYGGLYHIELPVKTVSFSELQSRVQSVQ